MIIFGDRHAGPELQTAAAATGDKDISPFGDRSKPSTRADTSCVAVCRVVARNALDGSIRDVETYTSQGMVAKTDWISPRLPP